MWLVVGGLILLQLAPPGRVTARDTPNDAGRSITVSWEPSPEAPGIDHYEVLRAEPGGEFQRVGLVGPRITQFIDATAQDGVSYRYRVAAIRGEARALSPPSDLVRSAPQWFAWNRINVVVVAVVFFSLVLWFISRARRGERLTLRKISGLTAVEEAVGRATEMGKPIVYVPGLGTISAVGTIASLNILGEVAKTTAQYDTPLIVPNPDPIVYTVAREVVKESYTRAGRPDAFNPDSVFFVTESQFAYAAAVDGIMVRERPAVNFFLGFFAAESLILAETGASTGAVQIAGTDAITQLPFFITACDYTLIGEELYAASAYLSREPLLLGAVKGQDYGKLIILGVLISASLLGILTRFPVLSLFR